MDKKAKIGIGVGLGAAAIGLIWWLMKNSDKISTPNDIPVIIDPDNPPDEIVSPNSMNIYVTSSGYWGVEPGIASYAKVSEGSGGFFALRESWYLNGQPLGFKTDSRTGAQTPIKPTCSKDDFESVKVELTDGTLMFSHTITPSSLKSYGYATGSNIYDEEGNKLTSEFFGSGKLNGITIYNNIGLSPSGCFILFEKSKYPNNAWTGANSLGGFKVYGYGTGALDYNQWTWTVCALLEQYWRPMNSGETVYDFTAAAYKELFNAYVCPVCGYVFPVVSNFYCPVCKDNMSRTVIENPQRDMDVVAFITNAGLHAAVICGSLSAILWNKAAYGDGSIDQPWLYYDGWQGAGYYIMLPGVLYGAETYVSEANKDTYF